MLKKLSPFYFLLLFLFPCVLIAQDSLNVTLFSHTTIAESASDIWGYVDDNNVEYAVIGGRSHTKIYSLEDHETPILRASISGTSTSWRDMKSYGDYVYSIQDIYGSDGLLIVDMSSAPGTISHSFWTPSLTVGGSTAQFRRAHNLYIDEEGYLYIAGSNLGEQGVLIFDLFTTPGTPIHVGTADVTYAHDVYARDSMMYTSEIYDGHFAVYDISDRSNPVLLETESTGRSFTHNAWLSDDGNTLFTTDEKSKAYVESYDISDLGNISELDQYRPLATINQSVIPHNVHVLNDFLIISHYTDGVIILDAAQPDNLIEVGNYDTYTAGTSGFHGCWGAYPFLPSGALLLSDIESGLYVLNPTYMRACYIRGTVRDVNTLASLNNVDVKIISSDLNEGSTDNFGMYASGVVTPGVYDVVYSTPGYPADTVQVTFANGETAYIDVFLGVPNGPCQDDLSLSGALTTSAFFASNTITTDGVIAAGEYVEMHANNEITLNQGFEVSLGAGFVADSVGCD